MAFKFGQRRVTDPLAQQNFEQLEGVLNPPTVTALPESPRDGDEVLYRVVPDVVPADATPLLWRLRWDTDAGAWLPVGRQEPIAAYRSVGGVGDTIAFGPNAWGNIFNDPSLTCPLTGTFWIRHGVAKMWNNSAAANNWYCGIKINSNFPSFNGTEPTDLVVSLDGGANFAAGEALHKRSLAAADVLRLSWYFAAGSVTATAYSRWVELYPRAITG